MNSFMRKEALASLLWRYRSILYVVAYIWRRVLFRTTFIAITGSVGKTTTKECIGAILSAHFRTAKTLYNQNESLGVPRTILRVRPWHRFAVVEIATNGPGLIRRSARLVRPDIAIVLNVARTHTNVFRSLEDTAAEKAQLLGALRPSGLAILNADDPMVKEMAVSCRCKVKMFGLSSGLDLWASEVYSKWPSKLSLHVQTESEAAWVMTNLVGEHWTSSVLASLLTALSCGLDSKAAIPALEKVKPFNARMQPVRLPAGAILLRDEYNGSIDTFRVALEVVRDSEARRRVVVMGDVSDAGNRTRARFRELGQMVGRVADLAVFVSEHAHYATKAAIAAGMKPECVRDFKSLTEAATYLKAELRTGDLVLLKGRTTDHLTRLFFAQFGEIGCSKIQCAKTSLCDFCDELRPSFNIEASLGTAPR